MQFKLNKCIKFGATPAHKSLKFLFLLVSFSFSWKKCIPHIVWREADEKKEAILQVLLKAQSRL